MVQWSALLPDVLPHVRGCANVIAEFELRETARLFFQATRGWQVALDHLPVNSGQKEVVVITDDTELELVRVEKAWLDGRPLDVTPAAVLDDQSTDDWTEHSGTPESIVQMRPGVVRLYPIPVADADRGLRCRVSVKPSAVATGIPDEIAVRFKNAIVTGAKARLMLYPGSPWMNAELAGVLGAAFDSMISASNVDAARAYGRGRIPSRPRWC